MARISTAEIPALNEVGLQTVQYAINQMREFVDQVYVPDTLAIAGFYKDWFTQGEGIGNFLTFGDFPAKGMSDPSSFMIPSGVILDRDLSKIHPIDLNAESEIQEFVSHAWYEYSVGKRQGLHPYKGETKLDYTGPKPPYQQLDVDKDYSWMKSPRWKGKAVEVGPLARVLMMYASGHEQTKELVGMTLTKLDLPVQALYSTMGRTAARTLETKIVADAMQGWYDQLVANIKAGDVKTFNELKMGSFDLAKPCTRRGCHGGAARRTFALDSHRRSEDRQLSGHRTQHLERRPARCAGKSWTV